MNSKVRKMNRSPMADDTYEWGYGSPGQLERLEVLENIVDRDDLLLAI